MSASSLEQVINYSVAGNFTFDTEKIEFSGDKARLKLVDLQNQTFTEDFADDTDFTYDSDDIEFVTGVMRQKDQREANSIAGATYTTDKDLNWGPGTATGTLNGGATVAGGALICTGGAGRNCTYNADNIAGVTTKGTLRVVVRPNTNTPGTAVYLWFAGSNLYLYYDGVDLRFILKNDAGGSIVQKIVGGTSWSAGTAVELMFAWDQTPGSEVQYTFVGGTLKTTDNVAGTKNNPHSVTTFAAGALSGTSEFDILEWEIYDEVKETANYTPYFGSMPEISYNAATVTLPEMEDVYPGGITAATDFQATESGSPRYTIQIGRSGNYLYWTGSAWATSDGSYSQATPAAPVLANIATIPVSGETYGQFKVHFQDSNSQSSVDNLDITMTLKQYPTDDPTMINNSGSLADVFESFVENAATVTGDDAIRYILNVNGSDKYWSGSAFADSDGSFSQANDPSVLNDNAESLAIGLNGATIKVKAVLHSEDGTTTPELEQVTLGYNFFNTQPAPETCTVWGFYRDIQGLPVADATVSFALKRNSGQYREAGDAIIEKSKSVTTDANGRFEIDLIRSSEYEADGDYVITVAKSSDSLDTSALDEADGTAITFTVPDQSDVNVTSLITSQA